MHKYWIAAFLVLALPSLASAGGGSTGSIKVVNEDTTKVALVAVNPSASLLDATTLSQFTKRGGRVINAGGSTTFTKVRAGNSQIVYLTVPSTATTVDATDFLSSIVKVTKKATTTFNVFPGIP